MGPKGYRVCYTAIQRESLLSLQRDRGSCTTIIVARSSGSALSIAAARVDDENRLRATKMDTKTFDDIKAVSGRAARVAERVSPSRDSILVAVAQQADAADKARITCR